MCTHDAGKLILRSFVKARRRFIQKPDRAMTDQEPRDTGTPFLPSGEIAEWQMADIPELHAVQRFTNRMVPDAVERLPEAQILFDAQDGFHGIEVTEIMAGRNKPVETGWRIVKPNTAFGFVQKSGDDSQER